MKLDLDELERMVCAADDGDLSLAHDWAPSSRQSLALIARIRELEKALRGIGLDGDNGDCNCDAIRSAMGSSKREHRIAGHEPDCVATNHLSRVLGVLEKGATFPVEICGLRVYGGGTCVLPRGHGGHTQDGGCSVVPR